MDCPKRVQRGVSKLSLSVCSSPSPHLKTSSNSKRPIMPRNSQFQRKRRRKRSLTKSKIEMSTSSLQGLTPLDLRSRSLPQFRTVGQPSHLSRKFLRTNSILTNALKSEFRCPWSRLSKLPKLTRKEKAIGLTQGDRSILKSLESSQSKDRQHRTHTQLSLRMRSSCCSGKWRLSMRRTGS